MIGPINVSVNIRFHDGSWETGTIVGSDLYIDLAVIHITSNLIHARGKRWDSLTD